MSKFPVVEDVLLSQELKVRSTTSLDKKCMDFKFETDRSYYGVPRQTFLPSKLKMIKGRGYKIYTPKIFKKNTYMNQKRCGRKYGR